MRFCRLLQLTFFRSPSALQVAEDTSLSGRSTTARSLVMRCRSLVKSPMGTMAAVRNYEEIFHGYFWYGTKPPGLFLFYSLAADAVQEVSPEAKLRSNACNAMLTGYFARLGPLLAALVVLPILGLQGQLGDRPWPLLGPLLAMSTPGMLLMLLAPDQMLFPLLATGTVFLWVAALAKQKSGHWSHRRRADRYRHVCQLFTAAHSEFCGNTLGIDEC